MADAYHHAVSSARKWGGAANDYLAVHAWFDESKKITCDFRHRALRHHAEGIALCVQIFGPDRDDQLRPRGSYTLDRGAARKRGLRLDSIIHGLGESYPS
jgi:hypothetical protein